MSGTTESSAGAAAIRPFTIPEVSEAELEALRARVVATRWPEKETVEDQSQGPRLATMQALARYWATEYDWRTCEARLKALPHFMTEIDGLDIHFIHVRSEHEDALPLIVTHGWPGSVIEQLKIIDPLTNPTAHGASAADAFHLVIPSMPGYGFSGKPATTGWGPDHIARAWAELMRRLGYNRYVAATRRRPLTLIFFGKVSAPIRRTGEVRGAPEHLRRSQGPHVIIYAILGIVNATVAVALITSASTLFGGALASVTTLGINRNQAKNEAVRSSFELKTRESSERRQIRRDAYLHLLNAFDETDSRLEMYWRRHPPAEKSESVLAEFEETEAAISAFANAANAVQLEGPDQVIRAAEEALSAFESEFSKYSQCVYKRLA
jgi:hypothetical protein